MRNRRKPFYPDDTDYTTNSPSYYDDLARKQKLIELLAKKIWEYDKTIASGLAEVREVLGQVLDVIGVGFNDEIEKLLILWVEDGTLDFIINETLMNNKADKSEIVLLEQNLTRIITNIEEQLETDLQTFKNTINTEMTELDTNLTNRLNTLETDLTEQIENYKALEVKPLELIAHRGFASLSPENTMTAFTLAHEHGADSLECDVHISSDGIPVIIHDSTLNRTTSGTGAVNSFTFSQLQQLDAGSKFGGELFNSSRIPSFDEFLKFAKGRTKMIYPEIKGVRTLADIQLIVDLIKQYDMEEMTCLQSFNFSHLAEVRKYSDKINFGYLVSSEPYSSEYNTMESDGNCSLLGSYQMFLDKTSIVKNCYNKKIEVGTWTVNNYDIVEKLLNIGVYKIMSNVMLGGVTK